MRYFPWTPISRAYLAYLIVLYCNVLFSRKTRADASTRTAEIFYQLRAVLTGMPHFDFIRLPHFCSRDIIARRIHMQALSNYGDCMWVECVGYYDFLQTGSFRKEISTKYHAALKRQNLTEGENEGTFSTEIVLLCHSSKSSLTQLCSPTLIRRTLKCRCSVILRNASHV